MDHKIFNDLIHGHMSFHPLLVTIIDTPQFQRLRNLKQSGVTYFVYPSACHNRFEHSLGTCHLAKKLLQALKSNTRDFKITEKDSLCVQVAALCHDIGHGPFSHDWERIMDEIDPEHEWKHEETSVEIFEEIVQNNEVVKAAFTDKKLGNNEINKIKKMILGTPDKGIESVFLYQIVNNKTNDIDVDKWDYLLRDQKMLNIPINFDHNRILEFCRVLPVGHESHITYKKKVVTCLLDMFLTRAALHQKAFQHTVSKVISTMFIEAMVAAHNQTVNGTTLDLVKMTKDDKLAHLTDHIYYDILYSTDDGMKKAREILQRIETRSLYRIVTDCEVDVPFALWKKVSKNEEWKTCLKKKIVKILNRETEANQNASKIVINDIKITTFEITMGEHISEGKFKGIYIYHKNSDEAVELVAEDVPSTYKHILREEFQFKPRIMVLDKRTTGSYFSADAKKKIDEEIQSFWCIATGTLKFCEPQEKKRKL